MIRSGWIGAVLGLALLAASPVMAQPAATPVMNTRGAFFALVVPDVEASARWYAETLGLVRVLDTPAGRPTRVIALEGGGLLVELIQDNAARSLQERVGGSEPVDRFKVHGIVKVGVMVEDFDAVIAALRGRGVPIVMGPFPARPAMRANAAIRDDNGVLIQLFGTYADGAESPVQ